LPSVWVQQVPEGRR